jgi:ABC-type amino acid transport substrate-binding protein
MQNIEVANTDLQNYKKLMFHRIDLFPGNEVVAKGLFKRHPELQGKLVPLEKSFIEGVLHMGISKKSPFVSAIPDINRIIIELIEEGFINKTIRKYTE